MNISGYKKNCIFDVVEMKSGKKNERVREKKYRRYKKLCIFDDVERKKEQERERINIS